MIDKSEIIECTYCGNKVIALHGELTLCTNCFAEVITWGASKYVGFPLSPETKKSAYTYIREVLFCEVGEELYLSRIENQSKNVVLEKQKQYIDFHKLLARRSISERARIQLKYIGFNLPLCTINNHKCSVKEASTRKSRFAVTKEWWKMRNKWLKSYLIEVAFPIIIILVIGFSLLWLFGVI